ncbi:hypothetical protein [Pseudomonas sp. IT-P218]|uniref:hypothetical protein n=1 Tax=Pseudomonas sp. IT-P218 TaxID=3026449 RepID=UPI0039DFAEF7
MSPIIKAVVFACTLLGFVVFAVDTAETYARVSAAKLVLEHRNQVQHQFADEREQIKSFVMTTVEREVSKAMHNQTK